MRLIFLMIVLTACAAPAEKKSGTALKTVTTLPGTPYLIVLGTIQDAGSPHIACNRTCCRDLFSGRFPERRVVSLGLVDPSAGKTYLFEATPDLPGQMRHLLEEAGTDAPPNGIFLTHAHIGHYSGLMFLGREAMDAPSIPVYVMPQMKRFIETNGPWNQLVKLENISLRIMRNEQEVRLGRSLRVIPVKVPHRDEYSETVGFRIEGPDKAVLFIPDIDKWDKWDKNITEEIGKVDYAFLDGSFYDGEELNYRDMSEIPHPTIAESIKLFQHLTPEERRKIFFIHLNHTNPLLDSASARYDEVIRQGKWQLGYTGQVIEL